MTKINIDAISERMTELESKLDQANKNINQMKKDIENPEEDVLVSDYTRMLLKHYHETKELVDTLSTACYYLCLDWGIHMLISDLKEIEEKIEKLAEIQRGW